MTRKCPNCGSVISDRSFRFCPSCRTKLPMEETIESQQHKDMGQTCPKCGTTNIDPSYRFCPNCRTPLNPSVRSASEGETPEEKGFLNRLFKTYEKAIKDPEAFKEWAKKNPNDSAVLLAKWSREGKDISMFAVINPLSEEYISEHRPESVSQSAVVSSVENGEFNKVEKKKGKEEEDNEAKRERIARSREGFSLATGGAADLIKGKAIWNVVPGEVARHITARQFEEVSDNLDGVLVEQGTSAIIFVDGQAVAELSSGLYTFATEKVTREVTEQILREENKEKDGIVRRTLGRMVRFFFGSKKGETEKKQDEKKARIRTLTRKITSSSVVSVYLKADGVFPALFGAEQKEDGSLGFKPYNVPTAHTDVEVGVNIQFQVADFREFIANYMQGKETVCVSDIQKAADPVVKAIVRHQLRNVPVDEKGIPEDALAKLEESLTGVQDALRGIEICRIVEITADNEDFDRFRSIERKLFAEDREYEYLIRQNEFLNRLESEKNRQKVTEAKTEVELQAALDEVNKDKLLHEDEMEDFYQHFRNMQAIRQATNDLELEKALLGLQGDSLVVEDDFEAIQEGLRNKKFEREQLSEVVRIRSLANTSLEKMSIEEELSSAEIRHNTNILKAEINAQAEIDDVAWEAHKVEMGRNAEDVDLDAAIYGRKFVLERQQLNDAIELDRTRSEYQDERRIREADVENELLDRRLAGQKKEEDLEYERRVRDYEFEHGRKADDIELERMRKQVEYDFERARKMDEADILEREQKGALEMMRQMQEQERLKEQQAYTHDENMLRTRATMSDGQLAAEQLRHLDKDAQLAYMESMKSNKEAEIIKQNEERRQEEDRERVRRYDEERKAMERARAEDREYTKSLLETLAGAMSGNVAAQAAERKAERDSYERIATHRIGEVDAMKEEYKDQMRHEQASRDSITDMSLRYTAQVSSADAAAKKEEDGTCPRCKGKLTNGFCPRCGWPEVDN